MLRENELCRQNDDEGIPSYDEEKNDKTEYEEALAKAIEQSYDNSSPENARPLIEELMQYRTSEDS